jgi:hypothetical protein
LSALLLCLFGNVDQPMREFDDEDDDFEQPSLFRRTPNGRAYVHTRCGGETLVSGGDFTHICDPFWPCTSTYCCTCSGFAPLREVKWTDTGEIISKYRQRLRRETPVLVQVWRYGFGFLLGGAFGAVVGLLAALIARAPAAKAGSFALIGALIAGAVCYLLGTILLNLVFGIDYRRMR